VKQTLKLYPRAPKRFQYPTATQALVSAMIALALFVAANVAAGNFN
jgi:hypothetical protein